MISYLRARHIGPVPDLEVDFGGRLNLVTGDNGLGKTFLLDACWYGLTRTWADGKKFYPTTDLSKNNQPRIDYKIIGKTGSEIVRQAKYYFKNQTWKILEVRPLGRAWLSTSELTAVFPSGIQPAIIGETMT